LHREELSEFFYKEAMSEMKHVQDFGRMYLGVFGKQPPQPSGPPKYTNSFASPTDVKSLLEEVLEMERQVVVNYAKRIKDTEAWGDADGYSLHVFYEDQIMDSRLTYNHVKEMLKGF
jgi:bacterioferritin (cytochrome b1)